MQTKLDTPQGQETYAQRKWLVVKRILGFRQFGMRGLRPVHEWDLVCLALNVKRLHRLLRN